MAARDETLRTEAAAHLQSLAPSADEPAWARARRAEAAEALKVTGLPRRRSEDWKYTHIDSMLAPTYAAADGAALTAAGCPAPLPGAQRLVFVDGHFRADLSDEIEGVTAGPLSAHLTRPAAERHLSRHALARGQGFVALNQQTFTDGLYLEVAPDTAVRAPIQVLHVSATEGGYAAPRHLLIVGAGAKATVVVQTVALAGGPSLTNAVIEAAIADNGRLDLLEVQEGGDAAFRVSYTAATLGRGAYLSRQGMSLDGRMSRTDIDVRFSGPESDADLQGLYLARGESHHDQHLTVRHDEPRCSSSQLFKGVLDGRGRGVFTGKVVVAPHAQQSKALQGNHNLLLSPDARANTRPQLEIYADDVQCSHGATVGQLDDEAMFYLRARGIGEDRARDLLTYAFAGEVLGDGEARDWLEDRLIRWLPGHTVSAADLHDGLEDL